MTAEVIGFIHAHQHFLAGFKDYTSHLNINQSLEVT